MNLEMAFSVTVPFIEQSQGETMSTTDSEIERFKNWASEYRLAFFTEDGTLLGSTLPHQHIWTEIRDETNGHSFLTNQAITKDSSEISKYASAFGYYVTLGTWDEDSSGTFTMATRFEAECPECYIGDPEEDEDIHDYQDRQEEAALDCDECGGSATLWLDYFDEYPAPVFSKHFEGIEYFSKLDLLERKHKSGNSE